MRDRFGSTIGKLILGMGVLLRPAMAAVDFDRDVRPILADKCYACHGPDGKTRKADLRLDLKDEAFRVRDGVRAIVPGRSAESELIRRISTADPAEVMPPPEAKLALRPKEIETLRAWVDGGAPWAEHWSFRPPVRPELPSVETSSWARNAVDSFVLARLEGEGLAPSPEARRETLVRRLTLDLTGLPPTLEEVDAFLADKAPGAYERLVERLLASPAHGERQVWEWLEAARYADTNGYQDDRERTMWPWRDWAIASINQNMPFDRFTVEQIAGDLLPGADRDQKIATAFNRNHMINGEGGRIPEENRIEYVFDQTETLSTVWLGLTVGCARCHDHKFDPLTQREYYQLFAFFNNTTVDGGGRSGQKAPTIEFRTPEQEARETELAEQLGTAAAKVTRLEAKALPHANSETAADSPRAKGFPEPVLESLKKPPAERGADGVRKTVEHLQKTPPDYAAALEHLAEQLEALEKLRREFARVMILEERTEPRESFVLSRGIYSQRGEKVDARVPAALPALRTDGPPDRLALARWLVDPSHPLTARVTVNRLWQTFFGVGFVKTVQDVGVQGEKPSHPALLDWLTTDFIANGWDRKHLLRLVVTSATYRQSSKDRPELRARDPENRLLGRAPRFRLPSFVLRDQALALAGLLSRKVGGPPVKPYQPPGIWAEATFGFKKYVQDTGESLYRRSLYTFWRRIVGPTMFFDTSARQTCTVRTQRTNTPLHALITLNETTYIEAARHLAATVLRASVAEPSSASKRVDWLFRAATARYPTAAEREILLSRLEKLRLRFGAEPETALELLGVGASPRDEALDPAEHAAFTTLASLILNLDEVLTKE